MLLSEVRLTGHQLRPPSPRMLVEWAHDPLSNLPEHTEFKSKARVIAAIDKKCHVIQVRSQGGESQAGRHIPLQGGGGGRGGQYVAGTRALLRPCLGLSDWLDGRRASRRTTAR